MTEYNSVEGEWVRVNVPASKDSHWNQGFWRSVYVYEDGIITPEGAVWERFVPTVKVPQEYGVYTDDNGDVWILNDAGWSAQDKYGTYSSGVTDHPEKYLPFTLIHSFDKKEEK